MLDERLLFSSCVLTENRLWYVSNQGFLMYMDVSTEKVSYAKINNSLNWAKHLVSDPMFTHGGCIYWVDQFGRALHEYNIWAQEYYSYELPITERLETCYAGVFMYANKLYMFPKKTPQLIVFDLEKKEVAVEKEIYEDFFRQETKKKKLTLYYAAQKEFFVYVFMTDMRTVWEVNLRDYKNRTLYLPQEITNIMSIIYKNNIMYILDLNGNVYTWQIDSNEICELYKCPKQELSFSGLIATERKLFMLPAMSEKILLMDLRDRAVFETNEYPNDLRYRESNWYKYWGYTEGEKYVWFATRISNYILSINKAKEKIEWKRLIPPKPQEEYDFCKGIKRLQQRGKNNVALREREYGMTYFLFMVLENEKDSSECGTDKRTVGMSIWQAEKE